MCGASVRLDRNPLEALVRHGDIETGRLGDDGRIRSPRLDECVCAKARVLFVCDGRRIWDYLGNDPETSLEREPMQRLSRERQLFAFEHSGFWQPMDTLREFNLLNELWAAGRAPWKSWV